MNKISVEFPDGFSLPEDERPLFTAQIRNFFSESTLNYDTLNDLWHSVPENASEMPDANLLKLFDGLTYGEDIPALARLAMEMLVGETFGIRITEQVDDDYWLNVAAASPVYLFLDSVIPDIRKRALWNSLLMSVRYRDSNSSILEAIKDEGSFSSHDLEIVKNCLKGQVDTNWLPVLSARDLLDSAHPQATDTLAQAEVSENQPTIVDDDPCYFRERWYWQPAEKKKKRHFTTVMVLLALIVFSVIVRVIFYFSSDPESKPSSLPQVPVRVDAGQITGPSPVPVMTAPISVASTDVVYQPMQKLYCQTGMPCAWAAKGNIKAMAASPEILARWHVENVRGGLLMTPIPMAKPASGNHKEEIVLLVKPSNDFWWPQNGERHWRVVRLEIYGD